MKIVDTKIVISMKNEDTLRLVHDNWDVLRSIRRGRLTYNI